MRRTKLFVMNQAGADAGTGGGGGGGASGGVGSIFGGSTGGATGGGAAGASNANNAAGAGQGAGSGGTSNQSQFQASLPENWVDSLPDDLKGEASLKLFKDIPSLAKSLVHAQKAVGADKIPIPSKHATDQDWHKNVFQRLGLPADPKEYNIEVPKDVKVDESFMGGFKEAAYKAGVLPRQANQLVQFYTTQMKAAQANYEKQVQQSQAQDAEALKKEWGEAYQKNVNLAQRAFQKFGDEASAKFFKDTGLHQNSNVLKLFAKVGEILGEDVMPRDQGAGSNVMTPAQAANEITKIMGDRTHPYHNPNHPGHRAAVDEMTRLFEMKVVGGQ